MNFSPGQIVFDDFEVIAPLGSHGPREVYRAQERSGSAAVILRLLTNPAEAGIQTRFSDEALSLSRVNHPNVASIRHFGLVGDDLPCLVVNQVNGPTLAEHISQRGPMDWPDAVQLVCQILDGLAALHRERLIHRDVCTTAIQLVHGDESMPIITNFGIAQGQSPYDTKIQNGWLAGNPGFMSPEQLYGLALDERSDVYSTALVLYSCITGHTLDVSSARDALEQRVMNRLPPMNPGPPSSKPPVALKSLVTAALEPDPALRPQNAGDFAQKLRAIAKSSGHNFQPQSPQRKKRSSSRIKVSTAPPKKGWKPPSWARTATGDEDPTTRPVSARLQTVKADDIISAEAVAHTPPPMPPDTPPPLPMEEVDDIFDADILSEEAVEETDLNIISETPILDAENSFAAGPQVDDGFSLDGLEVGDSLPPSGDDVGFGILEEDDDFVVPAALRDVGEAAPPAPAIPQAHAAPPPMEPSVTPSASSNPPLDVADGDSFGFSMAGGNAVAHAVIVARIPPKQLRLPSEARWLKEQIGVHSHGITVGQNIWVGTIVTESKAEAEALGNQAKVSLTARYGEYCRCEWTPVADDFEANSSNVLPSVVEGLIHYLSH